MRTETVFLPFELTNGNDGRTKHFGFSAHQRKRFSRDIGFLFPRRVPYEVPVSVTVVRILGKSDRLWDSSSGLRGNYKEIEDALVECRFFWDDSPKWITETRFQQDSSRRDKGPSIELIISSN